MTMDRIETSYETLAEVVLVKAQAAKKASRQLAILSSEQKNNALAQMADALWAYRMEILAANEKDVEEAQKAGQTTSKIDRLRLDEKRIRDMMTGLRQIIDLQDPIGICTETLHRPNGLVIEQIRVPMGVIAMIYESRPNVTVDAAGLALKTGNAIVLRGGREALQSNLALVKALREGLRKAGVTDEGLQFIDVVSRESIDILIQARGLIDLAIPRGGAALIDRVVSHAKVPVIETGIGNCHIYVDGLAKLEMAQNIVLNAKTQRPSVCNAAETLLVHESIANQLLPSLLAELEQRGVELRGCAKTRSIAHAANINKVVEATEADWETEFLDLVLAVKVVSGLDEAMDHIARYGTLHSEAIVTEDSEAAWRFLREVDAAVVYHNASTRFTDGFEFGFGAEIGISTQKLHARGPMGLRELTSYKYRVQGDGQIR